MLRRTILAGMLLAPLILSACDDKDSTGPEGTAGTVTVRAYVDSDGSGTFTTGDTPISGGIVTLTNNEDNATLVPATTNAQGIATFAAVMPGAYTTSLSGNAPQGAVLSSATTPTVVVPFRGGEISSEFRFVFNPGTISGQLYRDNNANNVFDAGDTPAPGQTVSLFRGTDTTATGLVGTVTTDNAGVFTFSTLRPGQYTVKISAIPTIQIVGGASQTVTVGANSTFAFPVKFTGSLIGTIAEARAAAPGSIAAIEGVVTVGSGSFNARSIYVQDATGGINVFAVDTSVVRPRVGDRVRVIGTVGANAQDIQLSAPTGSNVTVTILGTGPVPTPRVVTGAQINAFQFQGELGTINRVRVVSIGGGTSTSFSVVVADGTGTEFVLRINGGTLITRADFVVGSFYDITGVLNRFNTTAQLAPRSIADVVQAASSITIAAARQKVDGDTVLIEGVVTAPVGVFSTSTTGNQFNIQDKTGGILILDTPLAGGPALGDSVRVRGVIRLSGGELLLRAPLTITKLGTGTVPAPVLISGAYAAASTAADPLQGSLVRANNLKVTAVSGTATSTSYNVTVQEPAGASFAIRVGSAATGIPQTFWQVGTSYDVTGTLAQFNGAQIKVRSQADVMVSTSPAGVTSIAAAKARNVGDTVVVEGVVTSGKPGLTGGAIYVQDGTGGTQVFQSGGLPTDFAVGDLVRVRGLVALNQGEKHIARFSTTVPVEVTKIGTGAVPAPRVVTGAELLSRTFEGMLVRVNDLTVTAISTPSSSGAYNVDFTAPDGSVIRSRVESPAGSVIPTSTFTVGSRYDVIGIAAAFASIEQIKPRTTADIIAR